MRKKYFKFKIKRQEKEIQSTIMIAFTVVSIMIMLVIGIMLYMRFSNAWREGTVQNTQKLLEQTAENLEDYLVNMRQISDALYYNVIKESEFNEQEQNIKNRMRLLYEANKNKLCSIAIFDDKGNLITAEPIAVERERLNVTEQEWYFQAMDEMENIHFSVPHVQRIFDEGTAQYDWVISLSRAIEITKQSTSQMGVLLVDMDYSAIAMMMDKINQSRNGQYYYLCDANGKIIYHPQQVQIHEGISDENTKKAAEYKEGVYKERFQGERREVVVTTIGYTGWKLIGVIPNRAFTNGMSDMKYFIIILMLFMLMMILVINRLVAVRISSPILKLNQSVQAYEAGEKPEIYAGGSTEIRHLGNSIQNSYERIDDLMNEIVLEQTERRKSELDALQSQINPHFLYNALESITWMVEGERNDEAVFMISHLAKLFRISLSKGKTIISVKDELQHAKSYMNIQKVRYKNTFSYEFDVPEELEGYCTVKLILQPILENAINYGVSSMDDCGEITVTGKREGKTIVLAVSDNGIGMSKEEAELVLTDNNRVPKHGSGVGLINVNNRLQLLFGKEYGLTIESEPDEGTTVKIRIPAVLYSEEMQKQLEKGYMFSKQTMDEKIQEIQDEKQ